MARHRSPSGDSGTVGGLIALKHTQPSQAEPQILHASPPTPARPPAPSSQLTQPLQYAHLREACQSSQPPEPCPASHTLPAADPALPAARGHRSRHRPASRRLARHPLAAIAATIVAAGIFGGSQPVSVAASPQALVAAGDHDVAVAARSADAPVSRNQRTEGDSILAAPPQLPGAEEALVPDLGSSGSSNGPNGTAALTGDPCPTEGFGGVKPHVAQAGWHLVIVFGLSESQVGGVASRPGNPGSDHPRGYALDFMVDNSTGDAIEAYAEEHSEELGIKYILWEVANHYDHVHISFNDRPGSGMTC